MHGFSNSTEFTNLCASYGVIRGSIALTEERDKYPNVAKMVLNCYAVLDRTPSGSEINQWISKTRNGGSGTALVKISCNPVSIRTKARMPVMQIILQTSIRHFSAAAAILLRCSRGKMF